MCDRIYMPDGEEIKSITEGDICLCWNSQKEILTWIVQHIPELEFDDTLNINRDPFGYSVSIKKKSEDKNKDVLA